MTTLTATGRIAREETEAYVLEAVSGAVRQAFGRGLIEPMVMGDNDCRRDLGRTLADPELSGQSAFPDAAKREQERHAIGRQDVRRTFPDTPSLLLPRSRRSAGMILARVAAAQSLRSAASSEDLSGTFYRACRKTAPRTGAVSSLSDLCSPHDAYAFSLADRARRRLLPVIRSSRR